ncbi:MAG: M48 family metallopeptidase [Bacteroidetes bacterium]|nr:M48 family metallopeptidase [Bacteroidota bacterium]
MKPRRRLNTTPEEVFKARVNLWAVKIRVKPKQVRVQKMTRKWASCSTKGWVTFSKGLLHKPVSFQDFVIVHELLHLKIPNHGKLFKSLLSANVPGWRRWEKRVRGLDGGS